MDHKVCFCSTAKIWAISGRYWKDVETHERTHTDYKMKSLVTAVANWGQYRDFQSTTME